MQYPTYDTSYNNNTTHTTTHITTHTTQTSPPAPSASTCILPSSAAPCPLSGVDRRRSRPPSPKPKMALDALSAFLARAAQDAGGVEQHHTTHARYARAQPCAGARGIALGVSWERTDYARSGISMGSGKRKRRSVRTVGAQAGDGERGGWFAELSPVRGVGIDGR